MILLGIESSSELVSLGAIDNKKVIFEYKRKLRRGASKIIGYLNVSLEKNSLSWKDISCLVVGSGPGSFTSLRISFSVVKGLSVALSKPVISLGSFYSIAEGVKKISSRIAVVSDARRKLVYAATFKVKKDGSLKKENKEKLCFLKDFSEEFKDYLFVSYNSHIREEAIRILPKINFYRRDLYPGILPLLNKAKDYYKMKKFSSIDRLEPLYIYSKDCQIGNVVIGDKLSKIENRK